MSNICEICGEKFKNGRIKSNHVRWKHKDNSKYLSKLHNSAIKREERKHGGKFKEFNVICANPKCKKEFKIKERENSFPKKKKYFCSISCANIRSYDKKTRIRISKSISISLKKK
jgi:hypothetical protein